MLLNKTANICGANHLLIVVFLFHNFHFTLNYSTISCLYIINLPVVSLHRTHVRGPPTHRHTMTSQWWTCSCIFITHYNSERHDEAVISKARRSANRQRCLQNIRKRHPGGGQWTNTIYSETLITFKSWKQLCPCQRHVTCTSAHRR